MGKSNNKITETSSSDLSLSNGSKIAVIGGGPSGSFFSYFLLDMAERAGIKITLDIYEGKDFNKLGPLGCNHCGGIVSESLVQMLSAEGITIPNDILERGIDSYVLHMENGTRKISTPSFEKRIAAVYRGAGPLGATDRIGTGLDGFLVGLAHQKGATVIHDRVIDADIVDGFPMLKTKGGLSKSYDLLVGATGLKDSSLKLFEKLDFGFQRPKTTKTFICEYYLGDKLLKQYFGNSMHVFLLNVPRLEFAALIPKEDFVTLVMLGNNIDKDLVANFLSNPAVKECFPEDWDSSQESTCRCFPSINIQTAKKPYADRVVLLGDSATSKLYKNGIGAAYYASKAAASTAVFHGISEHAFEKHYRPVCRAMHYDNLLGKMIFLFSKLLQKSLLAKRIMIHIIGKEQQKENSQRILSSVLWDMFTGSAPYKDITLRTMKPSFIFSSIINTFTAFFTSNNKETFASGDDDEKSLGKLYRDGEIIVKEGDEGDTMFVIQSGTVEVIQHKNGKDVRLAELYQGDFFGEMSLFESEKRSATVRAKNDARLLTINKKSLLKRILADPSMAFRLMEKLSGRIRNLDKTISRMQASDRRNWESRPDSEKNGADNNSNIKS